MQYKKTIKWKILKQEVKRNGNEELFEDNYSELLEDNNFHLPNIK